LVAPDEKGIAAWRDVLTAIADERPAIASVFEHAAPLHVEAGRIVLGMSPDAFVAKQAQDVEALGLVQAAASAYFAQETSIELDWSGRHQGVTTVADLSAQERAERLEQARRRVAERPLVKAAIAEFGAQLRDIRLPDDTVH
jgi:DNA polymerase-3 subunit gamma/tau